MRKVWIYIKSFADIHKEYIAVIYKSRQLATPNIFPAGENNCECKKTVS